jgi:hypothetical protein
MADSLKPFRRIDPARLVRVALRIPSEMTAGKDCK